MPFHDKIPCHVYNEIRNLLSSIKGIASYYRDKFEDGSEDKEMAGIMIEEVDRIFYPYFTTKPKGTGLGLV